MLDFDDGVHLIDRSIWIDPRRRKPRAIVTHAHSDHVARHRCWVTSPATALLAVRRWKARAVEPHRFDEPWLEDDVTVTLLPAGHILGSSMVRLERAGTHILVTGDFRLEPSATAEPCRPVPADVLVMECTFGDPRYRFPKRDHVLAQLDQFIADAHRDDATPVLLAYSLGKAQEVARLLGARGHEVALLDEAHAMAQAYQEAGVRFERLTRFDGVLAPRTVLIVPPARYPTAAWRHVRRPRTAFLSGWALGGAPWRPPTAAAFALSDHADFDELIRLVELVRPRQVYTLHGPDRFARHLVERGWNATPARYARQMSLL